MNPRNTKGAPRGFVPGVYGHSRCVVRRNYAFLPPEGVMNSRVPAYSRTIVRFLAAPALGAEFAQALLLIEPGGGTPDPIRDEVVQRFFYMLDGAVVLAVEGDAPVELKVGGFAYIPPGVSFTLRNESSQPAKVLGLKKAYEKIDLPPPAPLISSRENVEKATREGADGRTWQYLLPLGDLSFDMEMNILSFTPGTYFEKVETHIMEHGLYMLEGHGIYLLDDEWHETWQDDFIWMGPFCPQLFYPTGPGESAYLLYKNVNRDVHL